MLSVQSVNRLVRLAVLCLGLGAGCSASQVEREREVAVASAALTASDCPAGTNIIQGNGSANTLNGTAGNDCILGLGGNDTINGLGGNDFLIGGAGNDNLYGGDGNDSAYGEAGDDVIEGGIGNDSLFGGVWTDTIRGGDGNDRIFGEADADFLYGDGGDDIIDGAGSFDTIEGGEGHDVIQGGTENDTINGGNGNDAIIGGTGVNTVNGGGGTDRCSGTSCELAQPVPNGCTSNAQCTAPNQCVIDIKVCLPAQCTDTDGDGTCDTSDGCPNNAPKIAPGVCGCAVADTDSDSDGTANCIDACPNNAPKIAAGICGCAVADTDSDGDSTPNCNDACASDPNKVAEGVCGCGVADTDSDSDGTANCNDACPNDAPKIAAGICGCAVADTDSDSDGTPNCHDACPTDAAKSAPGLCGCGVVESDSDGDGTCDAADLCQGFDDAIDTDSNGVPDDCDGCWTNAECQEGNECTGAVCVNHACAYPPLPASPARALVNGTFSTGTSAGFTLFQTPNGTASSTVAGFDMLGDGALSQAARLQVGRVSAVGTAGGGLYQYVRLTGGSLTVTADIATAVGSSNNQDGGTYTLMVDQTPIATQVIGAVSANQTYRRVLRGTVPLLSAGTHEIRIQITRAIFSSSNVSCYVDNLQISGTATSPEPTCGNGMGSCDGAGTCVLCSDADSDGTCDSEDGCVSDPGKTEPGACGCGVADTDSDADYVPDCWDRCPGYDDWQDYDYDGVPDGCDNPCPPGSVAYLGHVYVGYGWDPSELAGATCIAGYVVVERSDLTDFAGFEAIETIAGGLMILDNDYLTSVSGLQSLTTIGGALEISNNEALTNLYGLQSLESLGEELDPYYDELTILSNAALPPCWAQALEAQTGASCDTTCTTSCYSTCAGNTGSGTCTGIECEWGSHGPGVYQGTAVLGNWSTMTIEELAGIQCVAGDLWIDGSELTDLAGLSSLRAVAGALYLYGNSGLTNVDGLSALTRVGQLEVFNNDALLDLDGLANLETLTYHWSPPYDDGHVYIADNAALPACYVDLIAAQTGVECGIDYFGSFYACEDNEGAGTCNP